MKKGEDLEIYWMQEPKEKGERPKDKSEIFNVDYEEKQRAAGNENCLGR